MCSAFISTERDLTLFHRNRNDQNLDSSEIEQHYRLANSVNTVPLSSPPISNLLSLVSPASRLGGLVLAADIASYGYKAVKHARRSGFNRIYTREWQIAWLSSRYQMPTALELHEVPRSSYWRKFLVGTAKRSSLVKIVTISNGVRNGLLEIGVDSNKIFVAPDSVDLAAYNDMASQTEARKQLGLPADRHQIVYTGSLFHYKGVQTIIDTAKILPEANFLVVGGDETGLSTYRASIRKAGVQNITTTGYVQPHQIPIYQAAADVLIAPNTDENKLSTEFTSPLKLFEYMATKRPIVASSLGSIREILAHERTAILVEPNSATALASGISRVLDEPDLAKSISDNALMEVSSNTWNQRATNILDELEW
jgi:glycosyltransferase involved in cell wall biosynthesis